MISDGIVSKRDKTRYTTEVSPSQKKNSWSASIHVDTDMSQSESQKSVTVEVGSISALIAKLT